MSISLSLIVKASDDEAKKLDKCLASCRNAFDEFNITITGKNKAVEEVCKKYNARVSYYTWKNDFADARNYNFAQTKKDWIMWLDSDDILPKSSLIREKVQLAETQGATGLSMYYHYAHDKNGVLKDAHWKLQIVRNGYYEWKGKIHENLIANKPTKEFKISDVVRVHTATDEDAKKSLDRNQAILERLIKEEPQEPRHYFYLARCYLGTENWFGVIKVIDKYLTLSDWKEERYDAMNMMGEAYLRIGDYDSAIKVHTSATLELEDAPDAYIYKARNYIQKEEWLNALTNLEIAETRDKDAVILKKYALYDHDLYLMSAVCYLQVGEFKKAQLCAEKAYKNRGTDESKDMLDLANEMLADEELTIAYRKIGMSLLEDPEKAQALMQSVPDKIKGDPRILALQFTVLPPRKWPDRSVAIFCGPSVEYWDGNSVKQGGIGGSETAVIEIAKEMSKRGIEVTVYNKSAHPYGGVQIDGVTYRSYQEFNRLDEFDVLWLWRSPALCDYELKANKIIVDMHDVSTPATFTEERLSKIDHVFVKTDYHKSLYPNIPEDKFVVVGNGIDLTRFDAKEERDPFRIIYTSTQNRGLEQILDMWPKIRKAIPKANLHVFYGWNTFYQSHKDNPAKLAWMQTMEEKMQQPGITNHGRVGQQELAKEMLKSTIWLYPTTFPEIHCITALEMQASGVYPITSGFAALAETQVSGVKIDGTPSENLDKYVGELVFAIQNPDTLTKDIEKGCDYVKQCSWQNVTDKWEETLWTTQ